MTRKSGDRPRAYQQVIDFYGRVDGAILLGPPPRRALKMLAIVSCNRLMNLEQWPEPFLCSSTIRFYLPRGPRESGVNPLLPRNCEAKRWTHFLRSPFCKSGTAPLGLLTHFRGGSIMRTFDFKSLRIFVAF